MQKVVDFEFPDILKALNKPILKTAVELDVRSEYIRSQESPIGNWVADSIRNAYDEVLVKLVGKGADGVIATAGELRGNASFKNPPVVLTLLDLKRILHYDNPVVALELEGKTLWAAMESGLSKWPDTAGRFPAISGFHVSWDGSRPANQRVLEIWFQEESTEHGRPKVIKKQVTRTSDTKYVILVGEYLANGGDGYAVLKDQKVIIDEENGKSKFLLIKKFLKGAQALVTMVQTEATSSKFLHSETVNLVSAAKARSGFQSSTLTFDLPSTFIPTLAWPASRELYTSALKIAEREDLSFLDPYEWFRAHRQPPSTVGAIATGLVTMSLETAIATVTAQDPAAHKGDEVKAKEGKKEVKVLPTIHPVVDDRLKNAAPARSRDAADDSAER
ncbi:hypothetical protein PAXINDRAFT_15266 [Paxillus involutus ATCC 200175]|uniref:5'-Nucleotidase C-terminal domain-containing protein n=1 Tax=Paxillus involutus ATCC 200175 TaxID=664439 RepID=A0A0C9ST97_PAXIN|nr:hypothetical protein PAXINDRAFT_15266 [Paxillus involutus ATCC 200175]